MKSYWKSWYLLAILILISVDSPQNFIGRIPGEEIQGPYIDSVVYHVITSEDTQVLALQYDDIGLIGDPLSYESAQLLEYSNNIQVTENLENGYGQLVLNCKKYPFNMSSFRRAIAIALNKSGIVEDTLQGKGFPHDSVLPRMNAFSNETELGNIYYDSNITSANTTLDDAGFLDIDSDGYRELPDGSELVVEIESVGSGNIAYGTTTYLAQSLTSIGIRSSGFNDGFGWTEAHKKLVQHLDFDIVFLSKTFVDEDVTWLGYEFVSETFLRPYTNLANFRNASYDSFADTFLHSIDESDIRTIDIHHCTDCNPTLCQKTQTN